MPTCYNDLVGNITSPDGAFHATTSPHELRIDSVRYVASVTLHGHTSAGGKVLVYDLPSRIQHVTIGFPAGFTLVSWDVCKNETVPTTFTTPSSTIPAPSTTAHTAPPSTTSPPTTVQLSPPTTLLDTVTISTTTTIPPSTPILPETGLAPMPILGVGLGCVMIGAALLWRYRRRP